MTDSLTMTDSLNQLLTTFYRAFSGEASLLEGVVTPDWEDIPLNPGQGPGPDGIKPLIEGISQSFANFHIVITDVIDARTPDGNGKVGVRGEMRGTHVGDMFGIPGTGKDVVVGIHEFHLVENGRLRRTWHQEDWLGFFYQVGQAPKIGGEQ